MIAPSALPPESARDFEHVLKFKYSSIIMPRYLYYLTISRVSPPYIK